MNEFYEYDNENLKYVKTNKQHCYEFSIHVLLITILVISVGWLCSTIGILHYYNKRISTVQLQNRILNENLDIQTNECNYENVIKYKIGEYAMHPHHQVSNITKDSVAALLIELNAWYPDIIMAQIEIESAFGTSSLAKNNNNIVGMKRTNARETTQLKGNNKTEFGIYNNWESCIIDRVLWDYTVFGMKKPSRSDYIDQLNRSYGGFGDYGNKMDTNSSSFKQFFE